VIFKVSLPWQKLVILNDFVNAINGGTSSFVMGSIPTECVYLHSVCVETEWHQI
jgi:hypothetical protein